MKQVCTMLIPLLLAARLGGAGQTRARMALKRWQVPASDEHDDPFWLHRRQPKGLAMLDSATYIIGAEDALQVTVWKEPTLSGTFPVRPDGKISLVLLGDMPAAGLTPMQLGENITERLKKYIQDPSVSVVVTAVNSQRIFVVGEVPRVGPVVMTPGMTPLQAISSAGGLTPVCESGSGFISLPGRGGQAGEDSF